MDDNQAIPYVRPLEPKMGLAVARRTVFRAEDQENWGKVAERVALGNTSLVEGAFEEDYLAMRNAIAKQTLLMSGRHLQHGDANQKNRPAEVYTNCSTSSCSFLLFTLLLNGSGVGRDYSQNVCLVDWSAAPQLINVCEPTHPDFDASVFKTPAEAAVLCKEFSAVTTVPVQDSREGWGQAMEVYEVLAFERRTNEALVLDWSLVRPAGQPIKGMQNRPASGPVATARAFQSIANLRHGTLPLWKQAMFVDHYLAECVVVGGARRSARMSTKSWLDEDVIDFINIKKEHGLWSSNNSVITTKEFYQQIKIKDSWAQKVFKAVTEASYFDGTGEPGLINVENFAAQPAIDWTLFEDGNFAHSGLYQVNSASKPYMQALVQAVKAHEYHFIVNPCGEICLNMLGGYCVIADVVPYFADTLEEAEEAFRIATRALIRVNASMDSIYRKEVLRTNRIGVGFTGIHEFAWKFFGLSFEDILDEHGKGQYFWKAMARFARAVKEEAQLYAHKLGMPAPHTNTTVKPAGSTSKLAGITEGAHLPAMREYMRWVQFRTDDPLVAQYKLKGYPTKELQSYEGTTVVGFPTQPLICKLGLGDKLKTASEATLAEQYRWLTLIEKYWLRSVDASGQPLAQDTGNQTSITIKYDPKLVSYKDFVQAMLHYQSQVRAASVMPVADMSAYEYQPEEPITNMQDFLDIVAQIQDENIVEDIDLEHLKCQNGACPI